MHGTESREGSEQETVSFTHDKFCVKPDVNETMVFWKPQISNRGVIRRNSNSELAFN